MQAVNDAPATIFSDQWQQARSRIKRLRGSKRAKRFAQVLDYLEVGWQHVLPLRGLRARAGNPMPHTPAGAALYLLDVGLWECFRTVANECVEVICATETNNAPLDDLHADVDELHCNLHLARLLHPKGLQPELWQQLQTASASLLPWIEAFQPIWQAMADDVEPGMPLGNGKAKQ